MEFHCFMDIKFDATDINDAKAKIAMYLMRQVNDWQQTLDVHGTVEFHPGDKCAEYNL